jgi:hypothetical protein
MMAFVRSLAPARAVDAGRAVAVLPSRFASDRPLRFLDGPSPVVASGSSAGEAARIEVRSPGPQGDELESPARSLVERPSATERPSVDRTTSRRETTAKVRDDDAGSSSGSHPPHRSADEPPVLTLSRRGDVGARRGGDAAPMASSAPVIQSDAVAAQARDEEPTIASVARSRAAHAPLSQAVLASRAVQAADRRPVIHVTIERIDVRAPATSSPPPAVKPSAAKPSVSLNEYLRTRRPSRGGAGS